ncbi:MAG: APC family permease [Candidatus Zixiibacteriota bacterium]
MSPVGDRFRPCRPSRHPQMLDELRQFLIGSPIPSARETHERLSKVRGLAIFSSDALSSVAYATEEIMRALIVAGTAALVYSPPIAIAIVAVMILVSMSYFQTIHAYPSGGGAYIVARANLGNGAGLTAAGALQIDYILTVAVSTTAGVAAITSAFPALLPWRVLIGLGTIAFVTWGNLRGVRESGAIFAIPTYAFIFVGFALLIAGARHVLLSGAATAPTAGGEAAGLQVLTPFLLLRAFASGCAALTGIEAISNGTPAFRPPEARNAGRTLIIMAAILATMFIGITFLGRALAIVPRAEETVVSQIGRIVFGTGVWYFALQVATALILLLAANTSFAGFPRLSSILAGDQFMPRQFANRGDRLVYTTGILSLAAVAAVLIVLFGGNTHALIPLYAVGVFLAFTLSQAGMVRHWLKARSPGWRIKVVVNSLGFTATGVALIVLIATKFLHGAWIVTLLIPLYVFVALAVRRHYRDVQSLMSLGGMEPVPWPNPAAHPHQKVVVPVSGMHRGTLAALQFARAMTSDVTAVMADVEPGAVDRVRKDWKRWGHDVPLEVLPSPYRSTLTPLLEHLDHADQRDPHRGLAVVVIPEFVPARAWQRFLHNQTANLIKKAILYQRGHTSKDRIVINVPYHLSR